MPYTTETRIKHYRKNGDEMYSAQVRYKWPLLNIYNGEDFDFSSCGILDLFLKESVPEKAFRKA